MLSPIALCLILIAIAAVVPFLCGCYGRPRPFKASLASQDGERVPDQELSWLQAQMLDAEVTQARRTRCRALAYSHLAWLLFCVGLVPMLVTNALIKAHSPAAFDAGHPYLYLPLLPWGLVGMLLPIRPTQAAVVLRAHALLQCALVLVLLLSTVNVYLFYVVGRDVPEHRYYFWYLASIVGATVTAPTLLAIAVLARPGSFVRMRLQCIWRAVRLILYGYMLFSWTTLISTVLQYNEPKLREYGDAHGGEPQFARREYLLASFLNPVCAGALFALTCPPVRIEVQRRLRIHLTGHLTPAQRSAACTLNLGAFSVSRIFELARTHFATIPIGECSAPLFHEYRDGEDPHGAALQAHHAAVSTELSSGDAFVSHSSRDDPDEKAAAISAWASANNAADWRVWIDAACIGTINLHESLQCLPVFIHGSKNFLALVGPTFSGRLWCIMETFFYLQLRRHGRGRLIVVGVGAQLNVAQFDARTAQCSVEEDRQELLAIIEATYGTCSEFNKAIKVLEALT